MTTVLEVQSLTKGFTMHHLGNHLAAFDQISFDLKAGEFLLLKGQNGAGKSTLLRTLYRSYVAQSGKVIFHSEHGAIDLLSAADVDISMLRREEIGFVTQFLVARPRVSAEALVAEPLRLAGETAEAALQEARKWLSAFGVKEDLWRAYPTTFSGGEQQKVNLARALVLPQKLLLLDEPTASLDVKARAALVSRLAQLKSDGTAMIGVFHHPDDVAHLIDRVIDLTPGLENEEREDVVV